MPIKLVPNPTSIALAALVLLPLAACKSLSNDLGRHVYERELEDLFEDSPAGVIGTTQDTHLVVFRENSFVTEPAQEPSGSVQTQGLGFLREAAFRLAEARANTVEGAIALREAGFSEEAIAAMLPSREDWTAMYMQSLERAQVTIAEELDSQVRLEELLRHAERDASKLESDLKLAALAAQTQAAEAKLSAEVAHHQADAWLAAEEAHAKANVTSVWPTTPEDFPQVSTPSPIQGVSLINASMPRLLPLPLPVPLSSKSNLDGTNTNPTSGEAWTIQYQSKRYATQTIEIKVTCLDQAPSKPKLTATFPVRVSRRGEARFQAQLPEGWRLVRLDAPGAKPLFAMFM